MENEPKKGIGTLVFTIIFFLLSAFSWWVFIMLKQGTTVENIGELFVFFIIFASMGAISVVAGSIFTGFFVLFFIITLRRMIGHAEWKKEMKYNNSNI